MRYLKLLIEYDGTAYQGWQSQKSGTTIQDILTGAIGSITGEVVRLTGAGRTDAGVHAFGQVAVFGTRSELHPDILKRALNAKLPSDIRILVSEETSGTFHPRYDAVKKRYCYLISLERNGSAFLHRYVWHLKTTLDIDAMRSASSQLIGEHDFSSFRGSGCSAKTAVRTLHEIQIERFDSMEFMTISITGRFLKISIEANAFLRHMVRNIVGTLAEVGKDRLSPEDVKNILSLRDRTMAGPTAPACGLFLERVCY